MSGTIIARSGSHAAKLTLDGLQLWIGTFEQPDHARAAIDRVVQSPLPHVTIEDLKRDWCARAGVELETHKHNEQMTRAFVKRHGRRPVAAVIRFEAVKVANGSPSNARYLKALFEYGVTLGVIPDNPFARLSVTKKADPKIPPSVSEVTRAAEAALTVHPGITGALMHDMVLVAAATALRLHEQATLTAANLQYADGGLYLVIKQKGGTTRLVYVPEAVRPILERRAGSLMFPFKGQVLDRRDVSKLWIPIRDHIGLSDKVTWHSLRHYAATFLKDAGVDDAAAAFQLHGHHDTRVLQTVYQHPNAMKALARLRTTIDVPADATT